MFANLLETWSLKLLRFSSAKTSAHRVALLLVILCVTTWLVSCTGVSVSGTTQTAATISISPTSATLASKATLQFSSQIQNGNASGITWSASSGTISSSGLFTAPTVTKATAVTITATSASDSSLRAQAVATVDCSTASPTCAALSIAASTLPTATVGQPYSASVSAQGGQPPYRWNLQSGTLPSGIQLNAVNGVFSGTPSASGSSPFQVNVSDASGQDASQAFVLVVNSASTPSPLSIVTISLPAASANQPYSALLSASGGQIPYQWSIGSGSLPAGIQLDSSTGLLSGTATSAGDSSFQAVVNDASGEDATKTLTLTVSDGSGSAEIPESFFGMHVAVNGTSLQNPPPWGTPILQPVHVGAMGKCVTAYWSYVEQSPGVYNWSKLDTCTSWAAHFGVKYFQSTQYMTPASIGVSDPATDSRCWPASVGGVYFCLGTMTAEGEQQWIKFNSAMALRYKGNPGMDFYEGWNEPPYAGNSSNAITAAQLAKYETERVTAIHDSDPTAKVASPAFIIDPGYPSYATFMDDFLGQSPPKYDYYDFHIDYPDIPEDEIPMIVQYKQILATHGIVSPVIYATESGRGGSGSGASTDTCPQWPVNVTSDLQQAYIARMELLYWSEGVMRHYWYAYDTCGTLTNQPTENTLNPAGIAYGIVESWMSGSTMTQACAGPVSPQKGVWTCGLTRANGTHAFVVWDSSQSCAGVSCTTSSYSYDPSYTQYSTLVGSGGSLSGGTIQIGAKPILLSQ